MENIQVLRPSKRGLSISHCLLELAETPPLMYKHVIFLKKHCTCLSTNT